jgi:hypothetical protein
MKSMQLMLFMLAACMTIGAPAAIAQTEDDDKFRLSAGVFFTDRETDTRFDSVFGTPGTNVDMENVLGLDKSDSVFRIDGQYRFANKHQINFGLFDLS